MGQRVAPVSDQGPRGEEMFGSNVGESMPDPIQSWAEHRTRALARRPGSSAIFTYLLDADDDLAGEFDVRMRISARQGTTVRVLAAQAGPCDLAPALDAARGGFGLLILDGIVAVETRIGERTASELIGAGDLLQAADHRSEEMLERSDAWRALLDTRFALLDSEFAERVRPWPQIALAMLRRVSRRTTDVDAMRAIVSHPRLEVRLDLLFWHFAARWGRVEPGGIRLLLPLTHRLLGQLVAAERPSISHALARLSGTGLVTGAACDLHLRGSLDEHLEALTDRTPRLDRGDKERRTHGRSA
ncbi:MAG: hypothetical protein ACYC91_10755 [Solirubrobacteraceae bacterium]